MKIKSLNIIILAYLLSGCSISVKNTDNLLEKPRERVTNLEATLSCTKSAIEHSNDRKFGYLFIVDDVIDGTVPSPQFDGELSDSLRYELIHNLKKTLHSGYGAVLSNFPLIYKYPNGESNYGLNEFGVADANASNSLKNNYTKIINGIRGSAKKMNPNEQISSYEGLDVRVIRAAFTRNDANSIQKNNTGLNVGADGRVANGKLDIGITNEIKSVTLTAYLENPDRNSVENTTSFTVSTHENGYAVDLSAGYNDVFLGLKTDNLLVESKHSAQQVLVDAITLWILDETYGSVANIKGCMAKNAYQPKYQPQESKS
jgi:hypothetical protein